MKTSNPFHLRCIFYVLSIFLLAACGGGGGSETSTDTSPGETVWDQTNWNETKWQ